jgi:hypothetical protein
VKDIYIQIDPGLSGTGVFREVIDKTFLENHTFLIVAVPRPCVGRPASF